MRLRLIISLILALMPAALAAQQTENLPFLSPHVFALMAWDDSPSDPAKLALMRESGLNISGFCRPEDLKAVDAAGLTCFVNDSRANGYDWKNMPSAGAVRRKVRSLAKQVKGRPAAIGFYLRDEPDAALMPGLGEASAALKKAMPGRWPYINLLPNYTPPARLGSDNYTDYLSDFIRQVHPAVLSYDNYSLFSGEMLSRFYTNLGIIRKLALENGIPFWNVILSNAHFTYMEPSDATLHLQAYSTMAYGGRGIEYYTYFAPAGGNFRDAPVDQFGHRTATWYALRRLNNEIHNLGPWLAKLSSTGVYHSDPVPQGGEPISASTLVEKVEAQTFQSPPVPAQYLIGEFTDRHGHSFLMIVNKDLSHSFRYEIKLRNPDQRLFQISPYTGKEEPLQGEMNWLAPGAGALLELKKSQRVQAKPKDH